MTTAGQVLHDAARRLHAISPTARLDAELLLSHVLGLSRAGLIARLHDVLDSPAVARFTDLVDRRASLEPVAYLLGEWEFYGLLLKVDSRVLVPRPETELLVELALKAAARLPPRNIPRVADIGTGSGAIAIAVATHLPRAHVYAVDLSAAALEVAQANIKQHRLENRVSLLLGDGLEPLPEPVELLLSNPPYTILDEVDEGVRRHEPHVALDGGADGLDVIRALLAAAPRYLVPGGSILIEIASWLGPRATELAATAFPHATTTVHRDLAGHDRVLHVRTG